MSPAEELRHNILNSLDKGVTFTIKKSDTSSIDVLDVKILKSKDRKITTDTYHKPGD